MRQRTLLLPVMVASAATVLLSCGDDPSAPTPPTETDAIRTVQVSASRVTLEALGQTLQLKAVARDAEGTELDVTSFAWASEEPAVLTVDATGLVTAVFNGISRVTATARGVTGGITLRVEQVPAQLGVAVQPAGAASSEPFGTQPVIEVWDAGGALVRRSYEQSVKVAIESGGGILLGSVTADVVDGKVGFDDLGIAGRIGTRRLSFTGSRGLSLLGSATTESFELGPGPPNAVTDVRGNSQTGFLREALHDTLTVLVTDARGDAANDEPAEWSVKAGNGQVEVLNGTTDEQGLSRAVWILGDSPGENEVEVAVPEKGGVAFTARAVSDPQTRLTHVGSVLTTPTEAPLANVAVHGDYAYVGGMSIGYTTSANLGVRIVDVSNPADPRLVGRIPLRLRAPDENHSHGDAVATTVNTGSFNGDIAIVHNGVPDEFSPNEFPEPYGIWDVSDPANPEFLSVLEFSKALSFFDSSDLGDKPRNSKAVVGTHFYALYDHDPTPGQRFRLGVANISDPRNPVVVGTWSPSPSTVRPLSLSINEAGTRAYIAGPYPGGRETTHLYLFVVDIQDPARPVTIGQHTFPAVRGNLYSTPSTASTSDDALLILCDGGWGDPDNGILHILDVSSPGNIQELSTFALPESSREGGPAAWEVVIKGRMAYSAWFAPGVIAVDFSDPEEPLQAGQFRSPNASEPWLTDLALLGDGYLVAATVWWSGLYVLETL